MRMIPLQNFTEYDWTWRFSEYSNNRNGVFSFSNLWISLHTRLDKFITSLLQHICSTTTLTTATHKSAFHFLTFRFYHDMLAFPVTMIPQNIKQNRIQSNVYGLSSPEAKMPLLFHTQLRNRPISLVMYHILGCELRRRRI